MEITSQNFKELLAQDKPVLVDCWAVWCGPCKRLTPVIEELAKDYEGKAIIGKCNVEDEEDIAEQLGVMNVPTVIVFKNGQEVARQVGLAPKAKYEEILNSLL